MKILHQIQLVILTVKWLISVEEGCLPPLSQTGPLCFRKYNGGVSGTGMVVVVAQGKGSRKC